jgi:predicted metal-dependent phosphoesterase TrpH
MELVKFMAGQGVKIAALTDHNTVRGIEEFKIACRENKIKPITGLELYVKIKNKKFNLLWFNFDSNNPELHKILRETQARRRARARGILEKLTQYGFKININQILDKYNHYIPLNGLVDELLKVNFNRLKIKKELGVKKPREDEIIREYFYNKKIGRLHESYVNIERIIKLRKKIGGQLVLNHPGKYNQLKKDFLIKLKNLGFDGIEVFSPHHSLGALMYAQFIARELGFLMTGGSDFHRSEENNFLIRNSWNYFKIDSKFLEGVKKIIG